MGNQQDSKQQKQTLAHSFFFAAMFLFWIFAGACVNMEYMRYGCNACVLVVNECILRWGGGGGLGHLTRKFTFTEYRGLHTYHQNTYSRTSELECCDRRRFDCDLRLESGIGSVKKGFRRFGLPVWLKKNAQRTHSLYAHTHKRTREHTQTHDSNVNVERAAKLIEIIQYL